MIDKAYTEVYEILGYMNDVTTNKIPSEVMVAIKDNRDLSYVTKIDKNDFFNPDNISDKAASILIWLDLNYFATKESKKEKMAFLYKAPNTVKTNQELFNNEVLENIEKSRVTSNTEIIEYKKNIISKIVDFIRNIFKFK